MKYARVNTIPEGPAKNDLTEGKIYEISNYKIYEGGTGFYITDDVGVSILCRAEGCAHINNGVWDLFKELPETNQLKEKEL